MIDTFTEQIRCKLSSEIGKITVNSKQYINEQIWKIIEQNYDLMLYDAQIIHVIIEKTDTYLSYIINACVTFKLNLIAYEELTRTEERLKIGL